MFFVNLFSAAAVGGLQPPPVRRLRGAVPSLIQFVHFGYVIDSPPCSSWHTIPGPDKVRVYVLGFLDTVGPYSLSP